MCLGYLLWMEHHYGEELCLQTYLSIITEMIFMSCYFIYRCFFLIRDQCEFLLSISGCILHISDKFQGGFCLKFIIMKSNILKKVSIILKIEFYCPENLHSGRKSLFCKI